MSIQRSVAANFLASGWAALMSLAFVPLYVRYIGIESYALIGFFATLQAWLALLDMGLGPTLNREIARFSAAGRPSQDVADLLRSMEILCAAGALCVAVGVIAAAPAITAYWLNARSLAPAEVADAIRLMGLVIAVQWVASLYRSALLGLQRQVWLSAQASIAATVRALGTLALLAFVSPTIGAFFAFQLTISIVELLVLRSRVLHSLPSAAPPRFSMAALRGVWRFAAGMMVGAVLATVLSQLDKLLLAKLLPLDEYGYFMLMSAVAGALLVVTGPIHNVAYPHLAEAAAAAEPSALFASYHRFAQLAGICAAPAALMLSLFSSEWLYLWTRDPKAVEAVAPILSVWMIGSMLNAIMLIPHLAQLAHGWTRLGIVFNIVAVLVMGPAILLLVPRHGAIAAAWIWVAINVGYVLFMVPIMHTRILPGQQRRWYLEALLAPVAAVVAVALPMKFLLADAHGRVPVPLLLSGTVAAFFAAVLATSVGREVVLNFARRRAMR